MFTNFDSIYGSLQDDFSDIEKFNSYYNTYKSYNIPENSESSDDVTKVVQFNFEGSGTG